MYRHQGATGPLAPGELGNIREANFGLNLLLHDPHGATGQPGGKGGGCAAAAAVPDLGSCHPGWASIFPCATQPIWHPANMWVRLSSRQSKTDGAYLGLFWSRDLASGGQPRMEGMCGPRRIGRDHGKRKGPAA